MDAIRPQKGPQERFLATPADIAIYGGAAGGGKSWSLLVEPLRHINNPTFGAVILRRTYSQIVKEGGLLDESQQIYPLLGAIFNQDGYQWRFPSGAKITFAHMQHESNRFDWQGSQIPLIEFDELTHFTERQFWYLVSRNRSMCGVTPYIRGSCNPDPDSWVAQLIEWWIGADGFPVPERAGVLQWFVRVVDTLKWFDSEAGALQRYPDIPPKSVTFIPAKLEDNPILMKRDPSYLGNLLALTYVEQAQLHGGNWHVRAAAGKVFNKGWFEIVDAVPANMPIVRFWDLAATEKQLAQEDPDFTAGVKIGRHHEQYFVLDCIAMRCGPAEIDTTIRNVARQDGHRVAIRWEEEGGASGKRDSWNLVSMLAGFDARGVRPQGDKLTRAKGLAAQALAGNVKLLRGPWNEQWLSHMHAIPDGVHDDIMDASSGGFNELTEARTASVVEY